MIELGKEYTSGGKSVRILCVDAQGVYPVIGLMNADLRRWTAEGANYRGAICLDGFDLIEVKPRIKRTVELAIWPKAPSGVANVTMYDPAQHIPGKIPIAIVKVEIDCTEGEGL